MSTGKTQIFSLLCGAGNVVYKNRFFSCGAITSVFAVQYHYDEELAAGAVVASTLLSILILPAFALLVQTIG